MLDTLQGMKREQLIGLSFVVALHGAALYGLWSYRIIPTPMEAFVMVSSLIDPAPPAAPPRPKPPKPPDPDPPPPEHHHLVAEATVVLPDEPVAYAPPTPVLDAPQQPVVLTSELSVSCQEREPPSYPLQSMRLNEQGRVVLRVEMNEDGRVSNAEVKTSSGFLRLDVAAVIAVKSWRCKPAIRNGVAVPAVALQPFVFILEGR